MRALPLLALLVLLGCTRAVPAPEVSPPPPVQAPAAQTSAAAAAPTPPALRLPRTALPTGYRLRLDVDPARPAFSGEIEIALEVREETDLLWLNATGLALSRATFEDQPLEVVSGGEDFVGLRGRFPPGAGTVRIAFSGTVDRERSRGLYAVEEPEGAGWYAYTFFEPLDARRAFPCFDEPDSKVPWTLELRTPKANGAYANTRLKSRREEGETAIFLFEESPPMPSYLVAFAVGPFEEVAVAPSGQKQVPTRILVPRGRAAHTAYAREVTPKVVAALEAFLGLPYPYDKLDVLVVPRYWGTMEHPGLVAMGQPLALIKPEEDSVSRRQDYANILIHELGHYWFGNLVTMAWWDDTWLNEALTSWLDTRVTHRLEPAWSWELTREARSRSNAMRTDALLSAQPLRPTVETRDDITGSFENSITYDKGASVLRMLEGFVGPERFRDILRQYLQQYAWKNARTEELLAAVQRGAGNDARGILASYVMQPGLPLITAGLHCDADGPLIILEQERFVAAGSAPAQEWMVPVCLRSDLGEHCTVLDAPRKDASLPWGSCPKWLFANAGGRGYYRVKLTATEAETLLFQAKLQPPERLAVVSDLAALAQRGELSPPDVLALVPRLAKEDSPQIVNAAVQLTGTARPSLLSAAGQERFAAFLQRAFGARARGAGFEPRRGESEEALQTRALLLSLLGDAGRDPAIAAEARRRVEQWLQSRTPMAEPLWWSAFSVAVAHGDGALFDRLLGAARATEDRREKGMLFALLGGFRDPALSRRALSLLLDPAIDLREASALLPAALSRRETRDQAWEFLGEHFDRIASRMREDELTWLSSMVGSVCDEARLPQAEALFREQGPKYGMVTRALDNAAERARQCITHAKRTMPQVEAFLAQPPR